MNDAKVYHVAIMPPQEASASLISQVSAIASQPDYQVRMMLAGRLPKFIAHFRDESAAKTAVNSLRDLKLTAFTITESELRRPVAPKLIARSITMEGEDSIFTSRDGTTKSMNRADVFLILTGRRTSSVGGETTTTTTMKVNLPATLLTGGIPVMKRVTTKTEETQKTAEQFIRLYLRESDIPEAEVRQFDFDYSFLGEKKGPTATGNIAVATDVLRRFFDQAYFDDRLLTGFISEAKSISGIDLGEQACVLLLRYYKTLATNTN
jgi:hypothetical protein